MMTITRLDEPETVATGSPRRVMPGGSPCRVMAGALTGRSGGRVAAVRLAASRRAAREGGAAR